MDDADHFLTGLEAFRNLATRGILDDTLAEAVDDLVVHIGLEQSGAYVAHGFTDVGFRDCALPGEFSKDFSEPVAQSFKHVFPRQHVGAAKA